MQCSSRDFWLEELPAQVDYDWLLKIMHVWLEKEALPFNMGVLATVDSNGLPKSRTVAIREINEYGLLFFTQRPSAKVMHISANPFVSFTFMLPSTQRQMTVFGKVNPLSKSENETYWETYNQERRLRFLVYGTKSGQIIQKPGALDEELIALKKAFKQSLPERPEEYVGYTIVPEEIKLYQLNEHRISDSITAKLVSNTWILQRVVP